MTGDCAACGRSFTSLTAFDAHQRWDYAQPPGKQLSCYSPAALRDRDGEPRFRVDARGRWGSAIRMAPGAFTGAPETAELPAPGTPGTPVHPEPVETP